MSIADEIRVERARQDEQWGGPEHDDHHDVWAWIDDIDRQVGESDKDMKVLTTAHPDIPTLIRARLVKIAALAVAGIERIDRQAGGRHPVGGPGQDGEKGRGT